MKRLLATALSGLALAAMAAPASATLQVLSMSVTGTNWVNYFGTPAAPVDPVTLDFTLTSDDGGTTNPTSAGLVINAFNLPYPLLYTSDSSTLVIATTPLNGGGGCSHTPGSFCLFVNSPFSASPTVSFMEQSPLGGGGWRATKLTTGPGGAVPEPASWALMIGGLGLVGGAMRRRAVSVRFA